MYLKDDDLDSSHYVSASGMFNDSLYKSSGAKLKLIINIDKYLTVENSIQILGKISPEEVPDIQSISPNAEIGYILEVDLEAPVHLYDFFADYPLVSKKQIVSENWLSLYNERLVKDKEDETKGDQIGESVYLKPKMYLVLLAGHDPKISNDPDLEDPKKKHGIQKTVIVKMFSNEEAYTLRLENYCKRYMDNDLCASLEELYKLYYDIAKEENRERLNDKIE
ncbi:10770_t:CDS:2 [Funneliformis mosseae]|uniref:10770_t:CDS:1 n=1 Tax=Funneliformis mosseae TaxID=27381 RepID=A0A9N8ZU37_FUNMO|nr:10770_t:CDS:2 [Funneliformis mosseae]